MTSQAAAAFMAAVDQERAAIKQDAENADREDLSIGAVRHLDLLERFTGVIAYTQTQADEILRLHQRTCVGGDCAVDDTSTPRT